MVKYSVTDGTDHKELFIHIPLNNACFVKQVQNVPMAILSLSCSHTSIKVADLDA